MPRGNGITLAKAHYQGQGYDRRLGIHWRHRRGELRLSVKVPEAVVDPLTVAEVVSFLRSLRHYRDLAIVLAMALSGLRSMEVIGLRLGQVDLEKAQMRVLGKGKKERVLPMSPQLVEATRKYLSYERPSFSPAPTLFVNLQGNRLGQALTPSGLISFFRRRRQREGLARANPHRFRHTFGADMARAGMQLPTLQKLMGHADERMTLRYIFLNVADVTAEYQRTMARLGQRYVA